MQPPPLTSRRSRAPAIFPATALRTLAGTSLILTISVLPGAEPKPSAAELLQIKYDPPAPVIPASLAAVPPPAPGVIVMPQVKVQGHPIPLRPETIASPRDKLADAKRKYISPTYAATMGPLSQLAGYFMNFLTIGGGWHPGDAEATILYLQDSRLQRRREFDETASLITLADPAEAKKLTSLRAELFRHPQGDENRFYRKDIQQHDRAP